MEGKLEGHVMDWSDPTLDLISVFFMLFTLSKVGARCARQVNLENICGLSGSVNGFKTSRKTLLLKPSRKFE